MYVISVIIYKPNRYFVIVFMIVNIVWKHTNVLWQVTFGSRIRRILPLNRSFDVQICLLDLVDYTYIPNEGDHRFKSRRCQNWNFSSFRMVTKTNMADATLDTRGVKDTGNITRNSFTSFERTRASRRKPSPDLRSARDVMVWFVRIHHDVGEESFQLGASC